MKRISFYLLSFIFALASCGTAETGSEKEAVQDSEEKNTEENKEEYLPLIDNIDLNFEDGEYKTENFVRGRDAKYYNFYAFKGRDYFLRIDSENKELNVKIFAPENGTPLDNNVGDGPLTWEGDFENDGRATVHISMNTNASTDEDLAAYTLLFTTESK